MLGSVIMIHRFGSANFSGDEGLSTGCISELGSRHDVYQSRRDTGRSSLINKFVLDFKYVADPFPNDSDSTATAVKTKFQTF